MVRFIDAYIIITVIQQKIKGELPVPRAPVVVSEPDTRKIEKEGLINWLGWKCSQWNARDFSQSCPAPVE